MIRQYSTTESDLIIKINRDFWNRDIIKNMAELSEQIFQAKLKKEEEGGIKAIPDFEPKILWGVMHDYSICLDDIDFNDRRVYDAGFLNEAMIRFRRDEAGKPIVRIPDSSPRLYRHRRNSDNYCGYFLMGDIFFVCAFGESSSILGDFKLAKEKIEAKQRRLQEVYGPISMDNLVSIYLIKKFISI